MERVQKKKGAPTRNRVGRIGLYAILILYAVFIVFPFLIVLVVSLTKNVDFALNGFKWFPDFNFEGYQKVFDSEDGQAEILFRGFINSLWQTLIPVVGGLFVSGMAAFAYAKWEFPGKNKLFAVCVVLMTVPLNAGLASYLFYNAIGWTKGSAAVLPIIVPGLFGAMTTIFLMYPYIKAVPSGIVEAARIDGMGFLPIYVKIIVPLSAPIFVSQFLFGFVGGYNNYSSALLFLYRDEKLWTVQLALNQFVLGLSESGSWLNAKCAGALITILPVILLFIFSQKYFIDDVSVGAVKG